jgi:hypothetical protein
MTQRSSDQRPGPVGSGPGDRSPLPGPAPPAPLDGRFRTSPDPSSLRGSGDDALAAGARPSIGRPSVGCPSRVERAMALGRARCSTNRNLRARPVQVGARRNHPQERFRATKGAATRSFPSIGAWIACSVNADSAVLRALPSPHRSGLGWGRLRPRDPPGEARPSRGRGARRGKRHPDLPPQAVHGVQRVREDPARRALRRNEVLARAPVAAVRAQLALQPAPISLAGVLGQAGARPPVPTRPGRSPARGIEELCGSSRPPDRLELLVFGKLV